MRVALALALSSVAPACKNNEPASALKYEEVGGENAGKYSLMFKVKADRLKFCFVRTDRYEGTQRDQPYAKITDDQLKGWIKRAFGAWIAAIKASTSDKLTDAEAVQFIDRTSFAGCEGAGTDMSIEVKPDAMVSHVFPSGYPRMVLTPSFLYRENKTLEENTYHMILHEFGHTLGLGDTYAPQGLPICKPNQPPSVMCGFHSQDKFLFMELQKDDIDGVQAVYKRVHGGARVTPGRVDNSRIFPLIKALDEANDRMSRAGGQTEEILADCATRGQRLNPPVPRPFRQLRETEDLKRNRKAYDEASDVLYAFDQAKADADPQGFQRALAEIKRLSDERDRLASGESARIRRADEDFVQATNPDALERYRRLEDDLEQALRDMERIEQEIEAFDQQSSSRVDGAPTPPPHLVQPTLPSPAP